MDATTALERLVHGDPLTADEAAALMRTLVSGEVPDAQLGGLLVALRMRGVTPAQLAAFARTLQEVAVSVEAQDLDPVDSVGTGGGAPSFNLSTAAAVIAAAAGARVAKHGNRAVTSKCGAADVLEAVGLRLSQTAEDHRRLLQDVGVTFLYAPEHHPAMKAVGPVRRSLGIRTVFNQLGPLANPARARRQVVGVFELAMVRPMADALAHLGSVRAMVAHGADGLDEVSPTGPSRVAIIEHGEVREVELSPRDFGLDVAQVAHLEPGDSAQGNAALLRSAIRGDAPERTACVLPAAAAVVWTSGHVERMEDAGELVRRAVTSGAAWEKLEQWVSASNPEAARG